MAQEQYEPIFSDECDTCSSGPVVGLRSPAGSLVRTGFCGPHFFGDRLMSDPEEWNRKAEATE